MPYSKEHRERSRTQILQAASELFPRLGFDAVSIDQLMARAGLTRGAFYHHFANKGEVYAEAIRYATRNSPLAREKGSTTDNRAWFEATIGHYLSREHVEEAPAPCPLAFLVTDIGRREAAVRDSYTDVYQGLLTLLKARFRDQPPGKRQQTMMAVSALMIGGVALARAVDNPSLSETLLESCRETARDLLGLAEAGTTSIPDKPTTQRCFG